MLFFCDNVFASAVALINNCPDFLVNEFVCLLGIRFLITIFHIVVKSSKSRAHAILGADSLSNLSHLLDVIRSTSCNFVKEDLLCCSTTQSHHHHVVKLILIVEVKLVWEVLSETQGSLGSWNDSHLQKRVGVL